MIPSVVMKKTINHNYRMTSTFKTNVVEPATMRENLFIRVQKLLLVAASTYGDVPPDTENEPVAVASPKHASTTSGVLPRVSTAGSISTTVVVAVQLLASVTMTV